MTITEPTDEIVIVEAFRFPASFGTEVAGVCDHLEIALDAIRPVLAEAWKIVRRIDEIQNQAPDSLDTESFLDMAEAAGMHARRFNRLIADIYNMAHAMESTDLEMGKYLQAD